MNKPRRDNGYISSGLHMRHGDISVRPKIKGKAPVRDEEVIAKCAEIVRSVRREFNMMASEGRISSCELRNFKSRPAIAWVGSCTSSDAEMAWLDDEDERRRRLAEEISAAEAPGPEAAKAIARAALAMFELENRFSLDRDFLPHQTLAVAALRTLLSDEG